MSEHRPFTEGIPQEEYRHPVVSLLILLALMFGGFLLFSTLAVILGLLITGTPTALRDLDTLLSASASNADFLKVVQAVSSLGMFVLPPLLMGILERGRYRYLDFRASTPPTLWLLVFAILFFAAPILEQSIKFNEQLKLPEALSGLENWMRAKEAELEQLTKLLLSDTDYRGLLINLLVVAVIPAIGEEFLFRGCIQRILSRWFANPHLSIWITAVIFSAIHMQFYGFLPRLLLGALFGYLLYWGKNIWLPILAHFLNNASATIAAFYLQRHGKSLDEMDFGSQLPGYLYFVSTVLTAVLLYQYYQIATAHNTRYDGKTLD